jgi:uncharacterized protein (DUF1810 family)
MPTPDEADDLNRFVHAQEPIFEQVLAELASGQKHTHWMWFIFPQIAGLGQSETSRYYSIKGAEEARQYLRHGVLGARLLECTQAVLAIAGKSAREIFGFPDDLKLRSSMTLFASISVPGSVFEQVLEKYFEGIKDQQTLERLERPAR